MNKLRQLTKEDIINHYLDKPILIIERDNSSVWCLVKDNNSDMPPHLLSKEEATLYEQDESYTEGIEIVGIGIDEGYLLWAGFEVEDGWKAYGYEQ